MIGIQQLEGGRKALLNTMLITVGLICLFAQPQRVVGQQWTTNANGSDISNTNTGKVGVGTPSPLANLHVASEVLGGGVRGILNSQYSNDDNSALLIFSKTRGTRVSPTAVINGDNIGNFYAQGFDGTTSVSGARFRFLIDGPVTSGSVPTSLQFFTGSNGMGVERLRITSSGNVGIGTTAPGYILDIAGRSRVRGASGNDGGFWYSNSATPTTDSTFIGRGGTWAGIYNNSWNLVVLDTGNVGIGTTAPSFKLDVLGPIRSSSGGFVFPDGSVQLSAVTGGGAVTSAFGRTGAVVAAANDYSFSQISGSVNLTTQVNGVLPVLNGGTQWTTSGSNVSYNAGNVAIVGNLTVDGIINAKYQDVAEWVPSTQNLSTGTVVVLDSEKSNHVVASSQEYDTRVAGVISAKPGIALGEGGAGKVLVATTGRVRIKVDATQGPVQIGDLLVTSEKDGVAMKSLPLNLGGVQIHRPGTLIGKALEPLSNGTGEILVLLSLQ